MQRQSVGAGAQSHGGQTSAGSSKWSAITAQQIPHWNRSLLLSPNGRNAGLTTAGAVRESYFMKRIADADVTRCLISSLQRSDRIPSTPLYHSHRLYTPCRASAAAAGDDSQSGNSIARGASKAVSSAVGGVRALFSPFSDDRCNSQLLALAIGQALCSVATLIHDSYLPLYVTEQLGLSTTEVRACVQMLELWPAVWECT